MKYELAPDLYARLVEIVRALETEFDYLDLSRIECIRGFGSSTMAFVSTEFVIKTTPDFRRTAIEKFFYTNIITTMFSNVRSRTRELMY